MKIALIGQKGIPATIGGVERHTEELATRLVKRGHEVFVYARSHYTDINLKEFKGVKIVHLPSIPTKHLDAISHTFLATVHAIFQNYDLVQYHSIGPSSLIFLYKIFRPRTPVVGIHQSQDYYHEKWGALARICLKFGEKMICRVPDITITVTQNLADFIHKNFRRKSIVIPNGTNFSWNPNTQLLKQWNLSPNGYILCVSRFVKHKGIHYLIKAFQSLEDNKMNRGKKLVLVGDGFHTDDYVDYLKRLAWGKENVIFTGRQSGEALSQLFSHAYLFVQPSDSEGLSMALLEAMGFGKGILASNIHENILALQDNGFYFIPGNIKNLEQQMLNLINKPIWVKQAGERARNYAEEKYGWDKIAEKFESVYENLILQKKVKITFYENDCKV